MALGIHLTAEARERLDLETTTLWDFPWQSPGARRFGDPTYRGVTPAPVIANLLVRFTRRGDWVVDPMAGSGTTLDVARSLGRRAVGFDLAPGRRDVHRADARHVPLPDGFADLVFADPPYGDNLRYSDDPRCLGTLSSHGGPFYAELARVAREAHRLLRPGGTCGWLVSDTTSAAGFFPVGFRLFSLLRELFTPRDIVAVARRHDRSLNPTWEHRSRQGIFLLRGFKYLFIMQKEGPDGRP